MFSLRFLGGASLHGPEGPVTGPAVQRHRVALLALLAAHPGGISRDKLLAYLWPDRDAARARNLLKQAVHALRKVLGEEVIASAGDELRLDPSAVRADVTDFEVALRQGDPARAVSLYQGPFLDGFFLSHTPEFERWLDAERARFDSAYAKALESLADAAERENDFAGAAEWWKARAAHDPYDSRVALRLMAALDAGGNRAGALQHAAVHERLLHEEFGLVPSADMRTAVDALRRPLQPPDEEAARPAAEPHVDLAFAATGVGEGYATAAEIPQPPSSGTRRRRGARRAAWAGSGLLVLSLVIAGALGARRGVIASLPESGREPGAGVADRSVAAAPVPATNPARSIAVLPFSNLNRSPDDDYFSDGIADELISTLSQVRALRVIARTSAFAFKGQNRDIREIGRVLGVRTVLEGSVLRDGDRIRVTARLVSTADGFNLWSETYESDVADLFAVQSDLALRIADALETELGLAERARLTRPGTANATAHALYMKGRYFWNQRTSRGFAQAVDYFRQAIAADSAYAAAYAGLASVYLLQGVAGDMDPREAGERTRDAALEALALDDELAEAHTALGGYFDAYAGNAAAAERQWRRAMELDPGYPTAHHWYGNLLTAMGRFDEALVHKRQAVTLDPLAPVLIEGVGHTLRRAGRHAEAEQAYTAALEIDPMYWRAHAELGALYETTGRLDAALHEHRQAVDYAGRTMIARAGLARALSRAGRTRDARRMLAEIQAEAEEAGHHHVQVATVLLALDDTSGALDWLDRAYEEGRPELRAPAIGALADPLYLPLRGHPRFTDLLRRLGRSQ